jgi:hypothetical protein
MGAVAHATAGVIPSASKKRVIKIEMGKVTLIPNTEILIKKERL